MAQGFLLAVSGGSERGPLTPVILRFLDVGVLQTTITVEIVGGTAINGADYWFPTSVRTLNVSQSPAGFYDVELGILEILDDALVEGRETIVLRIRASGQTFANGTDTLEVTLSVFDNDFVGTTNGEFLGGSEVDDNIDGLSGNDTLNGQGGNDTLVGGEGNDSLEGGAGDDRLEGGPGRDVAVYNLQNQPGAQRLDFSSVGTQAVAVVVDGLEGRDSLIGMEGVRVTTPGDSDFVVGTSGNDTLSSAGGLDTFIGGAGDDFLIASTGSELIGGAGVDRAQIGFGTSETGVIVDVSIAATGARTTLPGGTIVDGVEQFTIRGTAASDTLIGGGGNDVLTGSGGTDFLSGNSGDDVLEGGAGDDQLNGGEGVDRALYDFTFQVGAIVFEVTNVTPEQEGRVIVAGLGTDTLVNVEAFYIIGSGQRDRISTGAGSDQIFGSSGDDTISAGGGDDFISGDAGADMINGEGGGDTVLYSNSRSAYTVTLDAENIITVSGPNGVDRLSNVEFLRFADVTINAPAVAVTRTGTGGADTLAGANGDDFVQGLEGDDVLFGGFGNDGLNGGAGADILNGESGADTAVGGAGADTVSGETGDDRLFGGADADFMLGGDGADLVNGESGDDLLRGGGGDDLMSGEGGVDQVLGEEGNDVLLGGAGDDVVDGATGDDVLFGEADADRLLGGAGADSLNGMDGDDRLEGGDGADVLSGEIGADVLVGGFGADVMIGGAGADRFVFASVGETQFGDGGDLIVDFQAGVDTVDLSTIDANGLAAGDQAFVFVGAFTGVAGQATLTFAAGRTVFRGDVNGDGQADVVLSFIGQVGQGDGFLL